MPYLRLSSLPLDEATKRHLADELTATVLDILPGQKPEWCTVHFTPFAPGDFAVGGRLVSDGAVPDTHLEISAPEVDEKSWFALRNRLTDVVIEALAIPDAERWHVNVKLNRYDPHSFAVAGNAADEISGHGLADDAAAPQSVDELAEPSGSKRGGWGGRGLVLGLVIGAALAYRWLSHRLANDAEVDAAEPLVGEAVAAGDPDGRFVTDAGAVREY